MLSLGAQQNHRQKVGRKHQAASIQIWTHPGPQHPGPFLSRQRPQSSPDLPLCPSNLGAHPGHRVLRPPTFFAGHSPCDSTSAAVFALQGPQKRASQGLPRRVPRCLGAAESLELSGEETQAREEEGFLASLLPTSSGCSGSPRGGAWQETTLLCVAGSGDKALGWIRDS